MKLYRYMSNREFAALTSGVPLVYRKGTHKSRTGSEGFCFLGETTEMNGMSYTPEECYTFLCGIVTSDVLVEMEIDNPALVSESWGVYAVPDGAWEDCDTITEYCTMQYNRDTFRPLRYAVGGKWYDYNRG